MKSLQPSKRICFLMLVVVCTSSLAHAQHPALTGIFNINEYGAIGDSKTLNTAAFNTAITACSQAGGGTVVVPAGNFLTGTVLLKDNVTLYLEQDAHIIGTADLNQYKSYQLITEDPLRPTNITVRDSGAWCRALILMDHVHDVAITGTGTIDGAAVLDKRGEEGHRGPHGVLMGSSRNITISGITVTRSGNYNILGLYVENVRFTGITISQGADGIHIRGGKNILIDDCKFYTGDDAIAGGYWENTLIKDCLLNSSCNGVRLVLPATNLEIKDCQIFGPGVFGHPRGTPTHPLVTRTLTGIILQPGAWGLGPGMLNHIYIHHIRIRDLQTAFTFVLNEGNQGDDIRVENMVATGITDNACSIEAWPDKSIFRNVLLKDISVSYRVMDTNLLSVKDFKRPLTESRPLPYWAFYIRNVKNIQFDNIRLEYSGQEARPVMGFEKVDSVILKSVKYKPAKGIMPFVYAPTTHMQITNTAGYNKAERTN